MAYFRVALVCIFLLVLGQLPLNAQISRHCQQAHDRFDDSFRRNEITIRDSTRTALADVTEALLKEELNDPQKARDNILNRTPPIPTKGQRLIVRRMEEVYCEIIFSEPNQSGEEKLKLYALVVNAIYTTKSYVPLTTTRNPGQASWQRWRNEQQVFAMQADFAPPGEPALQLTPRDLPLQNESVEQIENEFLAEAPFYVNDTNKYFVIVASPNSFENGVRQMNKIKEKMPLYDFALYPKYAGSRYLSVMMATWVSKDVARQALAIAREEIAHDAFIWCFPSGPCRPLKET